MRRNHQAAAYHNAFYFTHADDFKYKKDTESCSFSIRAIHVDGGIITACRSYATDIGLVDNQKKIFLLSWRDYSNTTAGQKAALRAACPSEYRTVLTDRIDAYRPDFTAAIEAAEADAVEYLTTPSGQKKEVHLIDGLHIRTYKVKDERDYKRHLENIEGAADESRRAIWAAAWKHSQEKITANYKKQEALREKKALAASEALREKKRAFDELIAQGVPHCIARHRAAYNELFTDYRGPRVFFWSGDLSDKIRTSGGIDFTAAEALALRGFETWENGKSILGRYTFRERDGDIYIIGCHRISGDELAGLRDAIDAARKAANH